MMNPPVRVFFLTVCTLFACAAYAFGEAPLSRHPYIQNTTQNSVVILWRTTGETSPVVRYGSEPGALVNEVLLEQTVVKLSPDIKGPVDALRLHSAPLDTYQFETTVSGLVPGTKYFYGIYDGEQLLAGADAEHYFTTLPASSSTGPLRLLVIGDSGNGEQAPRDAFQAVRNWAAGDGGGKEIDAYMHLGDMAYNDGLDEEFSANFFDLYTDLMRNTVTWPTMGNHEGHSSSGLTQLGPYYDAYAVPLQGEAGGQPSGSEAYYSFDCGRAHFICLNSQDLSRDPMGEMALWLKADLEMADADWLIAFWHHPPYTKGSHDSDIDPQLIEMRSLILPILESAGVDLVLCGHSHIYERSMLIDGAYATPTVAEGFVLDDGDGHPDGDGAYRKSALLNPNEGTVAVVAGNGRSAVDSSFPSVVMRSVISEVGSVVIDIDGDTLTGTMINRAEQASDMFQIVKRGKVTQQPVEFPWNPNGADIAVERIEPGKTIVVVSPTPAAPDTVIHYTTDGTQPTVESPVYMGPIETSKPESVRAMSVWRGGQRQSPTKAGFVLPEYLTVVQFPTTGADDGWENTTTGEVVLGAEAIELGTSATGATGVAAFRYEEVHIPPGAYIDFAQIWFEAQTRNEEPTIGTVWAELVADSAPFTTGLNDLSQRTPTVISRIWSPSNWILAHSRDGSTGTSNLTEMIEEVIALPGWQAGNAMTFFVNLSGVRTAESIEVGRSHGAELSVIFISPEGLEQKLTAEGLELEPIAETGRYKVSLRWPIPTAAAHFGLTFQVEMSTDLETWITAPTTNESFRFLGFDGFGIRSAEVDPSDFAGQRVYYRARASVAQP